MYLSLIDFGRPSLSITTRYASITARHREVTICHNIQSCALINLNLLPVPVHLHSGYGKLIFVIISPFFAIFKNVEHSLEPGETPSNSPGTKLCTTFLNIAKHDEIMSQNQITGTTTQPQRNRKLCQFNKDQYCMYLKDQTV